MAESNVVWQAPQVDFKTSRKAFVVGTVKILRRRSKVVRRNACYGRKIRGVRACR